MSYSSLMVYYDLNVDNSLLLNTAAGLAERFQARLIGIAAQAETVPLYFAEGYAAANIEEQERSNIQNRLQRAEQAFRDAFKLRSVKIDWRCGIDAPASFVANECRAADLVVLGESRNEATLNPGDLVMRTGRPLLIVPGAVEALKAERILIAWKDTREARRAVLDALPLLQLCQKAIVAEIDEDQDAAAADRRVQDVVGWLVGHDVNASGGSAPLQTDAAAQIDALARDEGVDLVVAGAYGRGKFSEWIFGGVTRSLLHQTSRCHFLSH